uniref:Chromo domain-containing protein n=1 Tax=Panagrolaimus sp. PS1159 TaxID=55785 RepID=A0AC35FVA4_9BILA
MFKALHLSPPIKENDIEVAKKKLKDVLGFTDAENDFDDIESDTDAEHNPNGEEFYVVEKVLDRSFENGVQKFKVKWEGHETATWEPFDNFVSRGSKMAIFLYFKGRWERKLEKKTAANQVGRASDIGKDESHSKSSSSRVVSDEARKEIKKSQVDAKPGSSKVRSLKTKSEQESKNEVQASRNVFDQNPTGGKRCHPSSSSNKTSTNNFFRSIKEKQQKMETERQKKREAMENQMKEERLRRKEEKDRERRMKQLKKDLGSSDEDEQLWILNSERE